MQFVVRTACERAKRNLSYVTLTSKFILSLKISTSTLLLLVPVSKSSVRISSVVQIIWRNYEDGGRGEVATVEAMGMRDVVVSESPKYLIHRVLPSYLPTC